MPTFVLDIRVKCKCGYVMQLLDDTCLTCFNSDCQFYNARVSMPSVELKQLGDGVTEATFIWKAEEIDNAE